MLSSRLVALLLLVLACGGRGESDPTTDGSTSGSATGSTSSDTATSGDASTPSTTEPTTSTGGPVDPDMFCGQFLDRDACQQAMPPPDVFCGWTVSTPARLVDGMCQFNQAAGACLALTGDTTAAGCTPPEGCDGDPFFATGDGYTNLITQCGGSIPVGYEPCALVEPGVFDPPECVCICDGGGSDSSSDGGTQGTGGGTQGTDSGGTG